jgi:N-acetylneuraminate synthase
MTFITAEIGINHNGDINTAKELINVAKEAGCDAVKFQKRTVDKVYTQEFLDSHRESPWGNTQRDQKNGIELKLEDYIEIDDFCRKLGIEWFASCWDLESQAFINGFKLNYNKIASAMLSHVSLLNLVASTGKHTFISTGMSTFNEIKLAMKIFENHNCPFELMHCVATYPMKVEDANLNRIKTLRDIFECKVGYSGHEVGLSVSCAALGMGISSLERHITLDRSMYGTDQPASLEPNGLRQLVKYAREIEKALGGGSLEMMECEKPMISKLKYYL